MVNTEQLKLFVVPELRSYWDARIAGAHAKLAEMSIRDLDDYFPKLSWSGHSRKIAYVDLVPSQKYDTSSAIIVFLPFATDWDFTVKAKLFLLQNSLPEHRHIVVFPNNTTRECNIYKLTPQERLILNNGSFLPILERSFGVIDKLGLKHLQIIGYSQGAAMGAAALRFAAESGKYALGPSVLIEPPNVIIRSPYKLLLDFVNVSQFSKVINGSGVLAYSKGRHTMGKNEKTKLLLGFSRLGASAALPDNRALVKNFCKGNFTNDLSTALSLNNELSLLIGGGMHSNILPAPALRKLDSLAQLYSGRIKIIHLHGYGHELSENLATYALMFRQGLYPN